MINVTAQVLAIENASLFEVSVSNHGLINPFANGIVLDQKRHDLLNDRRGRLQVKDITLYCQRIYL